MTGTTASGSLERLLGFRNQSQNEEGYKCAEGKPWLMVRFDPNAPLMDSSDSSGDNLDDLKEYKSDDDNDNHHDNDHQ